MAYRISAAEAEVLSVLWREYPLTAQEVAARLAGRKDWHERTVKTLLSRLLKKGALRFERDGRRYLYWPAVSREAYRRSESRALVRKLFGGRLAPLIASFAETEELSPEDIAEMKRIIEEIENGKR